ncbi:MAG: 23S rRNA (adenine(2503)-C(2))-methyltransferase RlmN [Anaerolineae bacterium]|jgi:23S rRNA (adenine2503-C2)-methyltransferase|nr:23S rRNA (adenine(2503)-C(2))-methyltransferase RlmN [Chloroflexota bacterium]
MSDKTALLNLSHEQLTSLLMSWGEPRFRAAQVWRWLYRNQADDPAQMANLPRPLRERLLAETSVTALPVVASDLADAGQTEKVAFRTADGQVIESVLMRYTNRTTVCVSSQIGCPVGCLFCATGRAGFVRDLSTAEISAQVLYFSRQLQHENAHVTNVVFMGMGEPMLNFEAVWQAILNLHERDGLALGIRRFTLSTVGIVPGIEVLAREGLAVGLAISLHAPSDALRNRLIPVNRRYPLARLLEAVRFYIERTGRRVTFEYALADGVNDSDEQAVATAGLLRGLLAHVNLIQMNEVEGVQMRPSSRERVLRFQDVLQQQGIQTTVRVSRGADIQAACGQLRSRIADESEQ